MLLILSLITAIIVLSAYIEMFKGLRSIPSLRSVEIITQPFPRISIIIPTRNEEKNIARTLSQLNKQTYPNLEIICVNDRSSDNTANIIRTFAKHKHSRIVDVHIDKLPAGWIAKNYASHRGTIAATGQWLLFIDADVMLSPNCLKRSMSYVIKKKLDHLSVFAHYICRGFFYNCVHLAHKGHGFVLALKPWLAKSKRSKKSFNIGVFCLVNKEVYEACGGHKALAFECVDDVRLGKQIKKSGFSQDVLNAQEDVSIEWYPTLSTMFMGLRKNIFSYFNYKLILTILSILSWYVLFLWPFIACFVLSGLSQVLNIFTTLFLFASYIEVAKTFKIPFKYIPFIPIGLMAYPYAIFSSIFYFYKNKGVKWRGTYYPAKALKKNNH